MASWLRLRLGAPAVQDEVVWCDRVRVVGLGVAPDHKRERERERAFSSYVVCDMFARAPEPSVRVCACVVYSSSGGPAIPVRSRDGLPLFFAVLFPSRPLTVQDVCVLLSTSKSPLFHSHCVSVRACVCARARA